MEFLCEYTVDRKKQGAYRFLKPLIIAAWIVIPIVLIVATVIIGNTLGGIGGLFKMSIFIILPLTAGLAKFFFMPSIAYGDVAYECTISSGDMSFAKIYGDRFRREWFALKISDMEKCAPYTDDAARELDGQSFAHVYRAVSSMDAEHVYYAIYVNDKNERCLVYFEVIKKSLKMIKTYHPATVMTNLPF